MATAPLSDGDRVAAVVQLDFAIETVLRTLLLDRKHPKARTERFRELLDMCATLIIEEGWGGHVPVRGGLEQARSVRNAAQHDARVPSPEEIVESLVHTRDALVEIVGHVWGFDFLQADVEEVRSDRFVELVTNAKTSRQAGDLHAAMGWLRAAFEYAFENGGENIVGPTIEVEELLVRDRAQRAPRPDPFGRGAEAATALRRLQVLGRLSAFNMSVHEYMSWRARFAGAPPLGINGLLLRHATQNVDWTTTEVEAALAYVVDSALKMERVVRTSTLVGSIVAASTSSEVTPGSSAPSPSDPPGESRASQCGSMAPAAS